MAGLVEITLAGWVSQVLPGGMALKSFSLFSETPLLGVVGQGFLNFNRNKISGI
jgi:hypothetical protein